MNIDQILETVAEIWPEPTLPKPFNILRAAGRVDAGDTLRNASREARTNAARMIIFGFVAGTLNMVRSAGLVKPGPLGQGPEDPRNAG